ncbi:SRPBCC family protein [Pontibacter ramchanderi]|uniref:Polyketide cyclase/dehydrase/lipid transport protein n=1 Tax=Pontibacter ramchanderi TaxID=1179743 RepID=A0A2N3V1D8_9BACT|nr:SRPBCC family protein [Pontibacter ramchanderi]PKV75448.1 polyketide cyclase/dehydrase/lipid transport protein [Pontibacter ramchanderi]
MKAPHFVLVSLLVASAAVYFGSFLLPDSYEVRRSIVVPAKPEQVFPYLNNPTEWEKWNAWNKAYDPTMIRLYGGPLTGKGAYQELNGDKVGLVKVHFTDSTPPSELYYKQLIKGDAFETTGIFSLEPLEGGTRVVWQQRTRVTDDLYNKYKGFFKKLKTEQETEQSLLSLKNLFDPAAKSDTNNQIANRKGRS